MKMQESLHFINDQLNNSENKSEDVEDEIGWLYYNAKSVEMTSKDYNESLLKKLRNKAKKLTSAPKRNLQITMPDSCYVWYNESFNGINYAFKPASKEVR